MADIYAFGPDWAIPPALQTKLDTMIGDTVDSRGVRWMKPAPLTKDQIDSYVTGASSGVYPVPKNNRVSLGIPAGDASGWLTAVFISTTEVGQRFTSLAGEEFQRFWGGANTGWNAWTAVSGSGAVAPTTESGWRDITATISPAPTTGRVLIRRSNKNVELTLDGVTWDNNTGTVTRTNLIPPGFQPDAPITHGTTSPHPGSSRAYTITSAGAGTFHSLTGGDVLNATAGFTTAQPWPSTLPGAAA